MLIAICCVRFTTDQRTKHRNFPQYFQNYVLKFRLIASINVSVFPPPTPPIQWMMNRVHSIRYDVRYTPKPRTQFEFFIELTY